DSAGCEVGIRKCSGSTTIEYPNRSAVFATQEISLAVRDFSQGWLMAGTCMQLGSRVIKRTGSLLNSGEWECRAELAQQISDRQVLEAPDEGGCSEFGFSAQFNGFQSG